MNAFSYSRRLRPTTVLVRNPRARAAFGILNRPASARLCELESPFQRSDGVSIASSTALLEPMIRVGLAWVWLVLGAGTDMSAIEMTRTAGWTAG
jgi:hypothetical protein